MATTAQINAAYDAVLPLIKQEEALAPFLIRSTVASDVASPAGVTLITRFLGIAIDAAAKVKT